MDISIDFTTWLRVFQTLKHVDASRHFQYGLVRRHRMLETSTRMIQRIVYLGRMDPLTTEEVDDLNVHLNALYLNIRGALDNLGWVLQYEFNLFAKRP
jgi:hypothetical protein